MSDFNHFRNTKIRNLWELMQNQEKIERQVRIDKRSKENLAVASIHPRMAQYEIAKKAKEEEEEKVKQAKKEEDAKNTFKANPVPDFEKLQKNFQDLLDAKRKSKKPTKAKGFAFQETRVSLFNKYLLRFCIERC